MVNTDENVSDNRSEVHEYGVPERSERGSGRNPETNIQRRVSPEKTGGITCNVGEKVTDIKGGRKKKKRYLK